MCTAKASSLAWSHQMKSQDVIGGMVYVDAVVDATFHASMSAVVVLVGPSQTRKS